MSASSAMALVPSKLLENWVKKWNRFVDVNNTLFYFKLLVGHSQTKSDKNLISYVQAGLATASNFTLVKAVSRFLIFIMLGSYKSNVAKVLERTFYSSYVPIGKKRIIQRQKLK